LQKHPDIWVPVVAFYMPKLFTLCCLLFFSLAAQAQVYYLDLRGQQLGLPAGALAVERVVDGRDGRPAIGVVYRGLGNRPAAVLFRTSLEDELTTVLQSQQPAPAAHPVVLCVRQLRVSEVLGNFSEKSLADLALDMYEHLPDGYHFVQSAGAHISSKALDATGSHSGNLAQLLSQCLTQLGQADWTNGAARPPLLLAQLAADQPTSLSGGGRRGSAPAILREAPRRGLYLSFEQFLTNRPDTSQAFRLDTLRPYYRSQLAATKWRGVARLSPKGAGPGHGAPLPKSLWGFSDGQQLFVQHNKQFFPLMRQGGFFTFVGEAPLDMEYMNARARAQARAQVTVVAVGVEDHTGEPAAYALDMRTGELAAYPGLRAPTRTDTAYVYVYRPPQPATAEVRVWLNGRQAGSLRPGEYLEIPWSYFAKPMQLCLDGLLMPARCQYFVPNTSRPGYLRVEAAGPATTWHWVPSKQGQADLDELDKLRK